MPSTTPPAPARDFGFGSDEEMLRDLARKFLDENMPVTKLRDLVAKDHTAVYERGERSAWRDELWHQIVELGWTGLAIPEEAGGVGFKFVGLVGLLEEVGRHALPSPLGATVAASLLLREADGERARPWLARIADGMSAAPIIHDEGGESIPDSHGLRARREGAERVLDGAAYFVEDAFKADLFVALVREEEASLLCVVPKDAPGLTLVQNHIHDLTRDQATLHFDRLRIPEENIVSEEGDAALERAWPGLLAAAAADLCGTSEWQLQATVEYAKERKQFDRPLGFFQAVKHPLVDAMIAIDRGRSLLYHAASAIDEGSDEARVAALMAKSAASDAAAYISSRSVQLHGGIGFTWECDVQLFFKRSMHTQALYGSGAQQRRRLAEILIGDSSSRKGMS